MEFVCLHCFIKVMQCSDKSNDLDCFMYSRAPIIRGPIICGMDYPWSQIVSNM
jgi:hypothetical protein